jgi:hypothetical protein
MKRRQWKPEQKALIVLEGLKGRPIGELCAEHEISQAQYYQWRDQFLANAARAFEPVVECPLSDVAAEQQSVGEVGWLAGVQCGRNRFSMLRLWMEDQLDLFAGLLLEGGDDLLDRLVLLGVVALIPPDDEIGGMRAERRQAECCPNSHGLNAHRSPPLIKSTVELCARSGAATTQF